MSSPRRAVGALVSVLALVASLVLAQAPSDEDEPGPGLTLELPTEEVESPFDDEALVEAIELLDAPPAFGGDELAFAAHTALQAGHYVRARELTEELLRQDADSPAGHVLLGMILHRGEGNLPLALFHLLRGRALFEDRYGAWPSEDPPWLWHVTALLELALVTGQMDQHETKLDYLDEVELRYDIALPADRAWPLMRLRRYEEAEAAAREGLAMDDANQVATAQTALCAIEAEQLRREASYRECKAAVALDEENGTPGPTTYSNGAEASLGMLRFAEAERLLVQGTEYFVSGAVSNPWLDLLHLYTLEARTAEALEAMRRMFDWRHRQPPYVDEHNRAETDMASVAFLLSVGRPKEAARLTERILDRPDRTGFTSAESEQMQAAAALLDRVAQRTAAELLREEASTLPFWEALGARIEASRRDLRAWASGRRLASLLTDERTLGATLRPYLAGSIETPEWLEPELVDILGPGVVEAGVARARKAETLNDAEGYFLAFETEAALRDGRPADAATLATRALAALPPAEKLLAARVAALGGEAERRRKRIPEAMVFYDQVMQADPGVVRRLGFRLPARIAHGDGAVAREAADLLADSPRFVDAENAFRVRVESAGDQGTACLEGLFENQLTCVQERLRAGEDEEALARRLVRELHFQAFAPRVDLTQADLRTLDGSPTVGGGRSAERLQTVVDEVMAGGQ